MKGLDILQAPKILPHQCIPFPSLTKARKQVIQAETAAFNWQTEGHLKVKRRVELQLEDSYAEGVYDGFPDARLLPGAEKVVLINNGRLEVWDISTSKCLWTAPRYGGKHDCDIFECDLSDDGKTLNMAGLFASEDRFHP